MIDDKNLQPLFFEYASKVLEGGFILDDENREKMSTWFEKFEAAGVGLLTSGNSGSGKTLAYEIMTRIIHPRDKKKFRVIKTRDIVEDYDANGSACLRRYIGKNCLFDDLGDEDNGKFWGKEKNVLEDIILMAYDSWMSSGIVYHFTTNLSHPKLRERYGARCFTRLMEMTFEVTIGGGTNYTNRRLLKNKLPWLNVLHPPRYSEWQFKNPPAINQRSGEVFQVSKFINQITENHDTSKS